MQHRKRRMRTVGEDAASKLVCVYNTRRQKEKEKKEHRLCQSRTMAIAFEAVCKRLSDLTVSWCRYTSTYTALHKCTHKTRPKPTPKLRRMYVRDIRTLRRRVDLPTAKFRLDSALLLLCSVSLQTSPLHFYSLGYVSRFTIK